MIVCISALTFYLHEPNTNVHDNHCQIRINTFNQNDMIMILRFLLMSPLHIFEYTRILPSRMHLALQKPIGNIYRNVLRTQIKLRSISKLR